MQFKSSIFNPPGVVYLMSGDVRVATFRDNQLLYSTPQLLPELINRTGELNQWLESRCIDLHRTNSRLIRKMLRLNTSSEVELVKAVHAATVTDNYWIRSEQEPLMYSQVKLYDEDLARAAVFGEVELSKQYSPSIELTNIGSFEKAWIKLPGYSGLVLLKLGNPEELFSESFTYNLCLALGFPTAVYNRYNPSHLFSLDFTESGRYNFEPMFNYVGEEEDYLTTVEVLKRFNNPDLLRQYAEIIFTDTVVRNPDRHTFNYGVLRNPFTGEIVSMAPNFDNNLALTATANPNTVINRDDILVESFSVLAQYLPELPDITEELLRQVILATDFPCRSVDEVISICLPAYNLIKERYYGDL